MFASTLPFHFFKTLTLTQQSMSYYTFCKTPCNYTKIKKCLGFYYTRLVSSTIKLQGDLWGAYCGHSSWAFTHCKAQDGWAIVIVIIYNKAPKWKQTKGPKVGWHKLLIVSFSSFHIKFGCENKIFPLSPHCAFFVILFLQSWLPCVGKTQGSNPIFKATLLKTPLIY